jgi:hypothetical protein
MDTAYRLGPTDLHLLRGLNHVFAEAFEDAETCLGAAPSDAYLAGFLAEPEALEPAADLRL